MYVCVTDKQANSVGGDGTALVTVEVEVLPVQFGWMPDKMGPEARAGEVLTVMRSELIRVVPTLPYYEVNDEAYRIQASRLGIAPGGVASGGCPLALGVPTGTVLTVRHYIDFYFAAKASRDSDRALVPMALMNPRDWEAQSPHTVAEIEARIQEGRGMPPVFRLV